MRAFPLYMIDFDRGRIIFELSFCGGRVTSEEGNYHRVGF